MEPPRARVSLVQEAFDKVLAECEKNMAAAA
jgi:hypothetical protein